MVLFITKTRLRLRGLFVGCGFAHFPAENGRYGNAVDLKTFNNSLRRKKFLFLFFLFVVVLLVLLSL